MGVELESSFRFADIVDVEGVYLKVRDIQTNKFICPMEDKIKCSLCFSVIYEKDGKVLNKKGFHINRETPFISVWEECYSHLKEELTKQGIQHTDKI